MYPTYNFNNKILKNYLRILLETYHEMDIVNDEKLDVMCLQRDRFRYETNW